MAIYSLRDVGLTDEESVQTLMNSLHDPDPMVRVAAVTSLKMHSRLSESGKSELLERFLKDRTLEFATPWSHFSLFGNIRPRSF